MTISRHDGDGPNRAPNRRAAVSAVAAVAGPRLTKRSKTLGALEAGPGGPGRPSRASGARAPEAGLSRTGRGRLCALLANGGERPLLKPADARCRAPSARMGA